MKLNVLSVLAFAAFVGFIATAMSVEPPRNDDKFNCSLVVLADGGFYWLYDCRGQCPATGPQSGFPCTLDYEYMVAKCFCGKFPPLEGCTGEFDLDPDGEGYYCYTTQGCQDPYECSFNTVQSGSPYWWPACTCLKVGA